VSPLPPGLVHQDDYLTAADAAQLLAAVDAQPWLADLRRRVQHYGYRYDYRARAVDRSMFLGPLPAWVLPLAERLRAEGHFERLPDQLIVNEYEPGQGITPHVDCVPCFGPVIASVSLGSTCLMDFDRDDAATALLLRPRSLLVFAGEARFEWRHSIRARRSDTVDGVRIARGRRVSLTFRTVLVQ
jgi:alkylated DNA repair dioxygenase AlkB